MRLLSYALMSEMFRSGLTNRQKRHLSRDMVPIWVMATRMLIKSLVGKVKNALGEKLRGYLRGLVIYGIPTGRLYLHIIVYVRDSCPCYRVSALVGDSPQEREFSMFLTVVRRSEET